MAAKRPAGTTGSEQRDAKRIPWTQIKDFFEGQWVELVEYRWDWEQSAPAWAKIRHHAFDRSELLAEIRASGTVEGSLVLYIGARHSTFELPLTAAV